jgi:hypothetical protein
MCCWVPWWSRTGRTERTGVGRRGGRWSRLERVRVWLEDEDLTVVKVGELLARLGVVVPARTLQRFAAELCGPRRGRRATVRLADGEPGGELQVDFGRMGLVFDARAGRNRVCWALIFTACMSRHRVAPSGAFRGRQLRRTRKAAEAAESASAATRAALRSSGLTSIFRDLGDVS